MVLKFRITPQLITLAYEAALKSFWRKNALKKFLRGCDISEEFLNSWNNEETKRSFLDRLFLRLPKSDKGNTALLKMALALSEQTTFPDLRNWEDSNDKIREATLAVSELKKYLDAQQKEVEQEESKIKKRKEASEKNVEIQREITDKVKLKDELEKLVLQIGMQQAGYDFQNWFYKLLDYCDIDNKKPYIKDADKLMEQFHWTGQHISLS
ncbi:MAG: hypothetical protein LBU51_07910 [Bacteroidales bacterium]|nr:hypothetical protein [Bacteroidales bacterium]